MAKQANDERGERLYLIGEVAQLGGISQRTLRHYDDLGLIEPDRIGENKYRYYSLETILRIPVINYLKMAGFSLEEISEIFQSGDFGDIKSRLRNRSDEYGRELRRISECRAAIEDWITLIDEANYVLSVRPIEVSLKYLPPAEYLSMPYRFWGNFADAVINLKFTSFVEEHDNVITGPVILHRLSLEPLARDGEGGATSVEGNHEADVLVLQRALRPIDPSNRFDRAGGMFLSTYHTGSFDTLEEAYRRLFAYARERGYRPAGTSYERYVTDYWTTYNSDLFVAEILLPVER